MINIIIEDTDIVLINSIEFIFINIPIYIFTKKDLILNKITNNITNFIFFNKFIYPKKNFINELITIINNYSIDVCFLSICKTVFFVRKHNLNFINNSIEIINNIDIFNILFVDSNYNNIDHIIPEKDINSEYIQLLKLYLISYDNSININISYKAYLKFLKYNVKNCYCYNIILFINNINQLIFNLPKYKFYRITIFHNFKFDEDILLIKAYCKKFNIISYYYINNYLQLFYNITLTRLIWFEKIIIFNNNLNIFNDDLFTLLNDYHQYKNNIILNNYISICATDFITIPFFNCSKHWKLNKTNIYILIKNYIINNFIENTYLKKYNIIKYLFNYKNNTSIEKKLFIIRDYESLINIINNKIKLNYDSKVYFDLLIKKVSLFIIYKNEEEIINDINLIIQNVTNIEYLNTLLLLFNNIKKPFIMNKLYIKILKLTNENILSFITLKCFYALLSNNMDEDSFCAVLCFIENCIIHNTTQYKINLKQIAITLFINLHKFIEKEHIITQFNTIINKIFEIGNILDIDNILLLKNDTNNNNFSILHFLIFLCTNYNAYYNTYDNYIIKRNKIIENLNILLNKNIPSCSLDQVLLLPVSNFYLSYQGIPSINIYTLKSTLIRKICPDINYIFNYIPNKNTKINICFHSSFLNRRHSVYKDRHQIIKGLAEYSEFNVYYSTFDDLCDDVKYTFGKAKHIKINSSNLNDIKNTLEKLNLDILIYCEIGMDQRSYYLAHMRLARVQINTWGHSDSSGIDTIDYFFSSQFYELPYNQSQTHYSEKLILLNSLCTCYISPLLSYNISIFKNRYEFGFSDDSIIYFCAQSLFKFNPLFDEYIIKILEHNKNFIIIISNNNNKDEFIKRFNNKHIFSQIHIVNSMPHYHYMNLIYISDVILDPYPFGGCNSSLEALSLNKVIVTQESNMINGRFTSGFYKKMKLDYIITKNKKKYIEFAINLGINIKYRKTIEKLIEKNNNCLFNDQESIKEWKEQLLLCLNKL